MTSHARDKPLPEIKKIVVNDLVKRIESSRTVLFASCQGLPGRQFHDIKKKLRGQAEIKVAKKSAVIRAIDKIEKGTVKNLKKEIKEDIAIFFSNLDPFELSGLLTESLSSRRAKAGDIAPEDIEIEAGSTDLPPGPAISELSGVGLKVAVKEGKLEIIKGAIVVKKGAEIKANVAGVLAKVNISPIRVGFVPIAAYDAKDDVIYTNIVIDKKGTLESLQDMIKKSLGFAASIGFPTKETISYLIAKAASHEKALAAKIQDQPIREGQ